ncbi:MAG: TonB-dependent receptor [Alistipes sp.]|nr:TonB-dependent receptor [Alistipes sp.]
MKKFTLCLLGMLLLAIPMEAQNRTRPTDAHLFGHVVDHKTQDHVAYATIVLAGTTIGTTTDATGHFFIKNVPFGDYTVEVRALGYRTQRQEVCLHQSGSIEVNFEVIEEAVSMDQVVVSASRSETLKREAPSLVSVLDSELFERVSTASLGGGLAYQPGVRVENTCQNCGFPQVRINGLDGRYSQILVDSHPLFSALTGVYGLEQIPANMIERVEVLRGGGSALYGSSAIGGTINVITKEPTRSMAEMGHTITSLGCSGSFDNTTTLNASLVSDSGKAAIAVFAQSRTADGYDENGDGFTELLDMNSEALGMRAYFRTGAYSRLTAQYHRIKDYRRGGDQLDVPPHESMTCEQADHTIDGGSLSFDWSDADRSDRVNLYASFQNTDRSSYYGAFQDPDAYGRTHDLTLAAGAQYVHAFKRLLFLPSELTLGAEYSHNDLHDRSIGYAIDTRQKTHIYGGYFQNEWKNKQWSLLVGGRLDKHNLVEDLIFSPRVNLRYNPSEELSLRLSYAGGYRAPQAYDEDLHIAIVGGERTRIRLAENLKEERSGSWSASAEWYHTFGSVATNFVVEGFYTTLDDVFALREVGHDTDGATIQERYNGSGATVGGVNLEGRAVFSERCELQAGFTWQESRYKEPEYWSEDEAVAPSKRMFRTPDTYGYFTLLVKPWRPLEIDLTGNYTGRMLVQHYAGSGTEQDVAVETPHFFDLNLRAAYTFNLYKDVKMELYGGVKNLFDAYQDDFDTGAERDSGYVYGPLLPRSWFLGVKVRF